MSRKVRVERRNNQDGTAEVALILGPMSLKSGDAWEEVLKRQVAAGKVMVDLAVD